MRRVLLPALSALLLASCATTTRLPAEEVLLRSARAGQELQSVAFEGSADMTQGKSDAERRWTVTLEDGLMQEGGKVLRFSALIEQPPQAGSEGNPFRASVDAVLLWSRESYVRLNSLEGSERTTFLNAEALENLRGKWWLFPTGDQESAPEDVTPDPRILRAQFEVISVVKDHGIESIGGRQAYHYTVAVDPVKLKNFLRVWSEEKDEEFDEASVDAFIAAYDLRGEVWIDVTSFHLHRLSWDITGKNEESPFRLTFMLSFSDHNGAPAVTVPTDAEPFSLSALLGGSDGERFLPADFPVLP